MKQEIILISLPIQDLQKMIYQGCQEALESQLQMSKTEGNTQEGKPLCIDDVCEFFGKSRPTIYDWMHKGYLKFYKISNRTYFLRKDLFDALKGFQLKEGRDK